MQDHQNQFLSGMTQICADIDELMPQFTEFANHYKGLAIAQQAHIPPALEIWPESLANGVAGYTPGQLR